MELERLKSKLRAIARKELRGSAIIVGGYRKKSSRHKSRRMSASALLAGRRRKSSRRMSGRALLAGRRRKSSRRVAGRKSRKNTRGTNALKHINSIAKQLKRKYPHMQHTEAISEASRMYNNGH